MGWVISGDTVLRGMLPMIILLSTEILFQPVDILNYKREEKNPKNDTSFNECTQLKSLNYLCTNSTKLTYCERILNVYDVATFEIRGGKGRNGYGPSINLVLALIHS